MDRLREDLFAILGVEDNCLEERCTESQAPRASSHGRSLAGNSGLKTRAATAE